NSHHWNHRTSDHAVFSAGPVRRRFGSASAADFKTLLLTENTQRVICVLSKIGHLALLQKKTGPYALLRRGAGHVVGLDALRGRQVEHPRRAGIVSALQGVVADDHGLGVVA